MDLKAARALAWPNVGGPALLRLVAFGLILSGGIALALGVSGRFLPR